MAARVYNSTKTIPASTTLPSRRHHWLLWLIGFVALAAVGFAAYVWVSLHYAYSTGVRAGYVQKLSHKGWACKTWEGELAQTTVPGTAPQIFQFSVRDDAVAHQIEQTEGQRVALSYEQHKGVPTDCFGDTEYYVTGVRQVGP